MRLWVAWVALLQWLFLNSHKKAQAMSFEKETVKAIKDLQGISTQLLSRQLALGAMTRALVGRIPLAALTAVLEEYEAEVDHQVALMPPKLQQPQYWQEWSDVLQARIKQLGQLPGQG